MVATTSLALAGTASAGGKTVVNKPVSGGATVLGCSHAHPDVDHRSYANLFDGNGVNTRSGPHTGCGSHGLGYRSHRVDYHCYDEGTVVNGYTTWTYLRNVSTGVRGWVSDALLDVNSNGTRGSLVHC